MNFVQTTFLIGTAAVAIPLIVHLLSRLQIRRIELGTMRFLREVVQEGAHRRKIRRWFLLLTRALLMLLLALLFARPFLIEQSKRDGDRLRIVLIDRSASMGMQGKEGRLVDDAIAAATESVSDLGLDAKVLWARFDRHVEPMPADTVRPAVPDSLVGDTDYVAALRWARDRLDAFPESVSDVVLVTDLQKSGFGVQVPASEGLRFPADVPVQVIDVGRPVANNLAITHAAPEATNLKIYHDVQVKVTLFNYGVLPFEDIPATASATNGVKTLRLKKSVNINNGEAEEISFDFGKLQPGTWQVTIAVDVEDDLAVDNRRFTAVQVTEPIKVLVLDSGASADGAAAGSYFVVAALQQSAGRHPEERAHDAIAQHNGRFQAETVFLEEQPVKILNVAEHPLVVVSGAGGLSETVIQQLDGYVNEGGELLVFAGDGTEKNSSFWKDAGLAPGDLGVTQRSGVMPFRIVSVNAKQTMMQPFEDPQHADLSRLAFRQMLPVSVASTTDVLAWFDQSRPAMTQHRHGNGRVVWFLSSADSSWSNWTTSPLYLPVVQQMAADLLDLTGEGPIRFRSIGDNDTPTDRTTSVPNKTYISVRTNDESPHLSAPTFAQPGFEQRADGLYIVNGSARESDPVRADVLSFVEHFELSVPDVSEHPEVASVVAEKRRELWPWLAAAVCILVMAEFSLSNRTSA